MGRSRRSVEPRTHFAVWGAGQGGGPTKYCSIRCVLIHFLCENCAREVLPGVKGLEYLGVQTYPRPDPGATTNQLCVSGQHTESLWSCPLTWKGNKKSL